VQYAKALADYQQAIAIGPPANPQYQDAGTAAYQLGLYAPAVRYFTQAILYLPSDVSAYFYRAFARLETGDKPGAIANLRQAVVLYKQQGNVAGAERGSNELARLDSTP